MLQKIFKSLLIVSFLFTFLTINVYSKNSNDYANMTKTEIKSKMNEYFNFIDAYSGNPIFKRIANQMKIEYDNAKKALDSQSYKYPYTNEDLQLLAYMIDIEAGANIVSDEEQCLVASVIINRKEQGGINQNKIKPSIKDIINEPGQYSITKYSKKLRKNTRYVDLDFIKNKEISERAICNATKVLEREFVPPQGVIFQALFPQGEIYKTFEHGAPFNNTTYFCYGRSSKNG